MIPRFRVPDEFDPAPDCAPDLVEAAEDEVGRCRDLLTAQLDLIAARREAGVPWGGALLGLKELSVRLEAAEAFLRECRGQAVSAA